MISKNVVIANGETRMMHQNGVRRNSNRWGLAVLLLSKCAVTTHGAVTLWHQRENFKDFYQRKFQGTSGMFGDGKPGSLSVLYSLGDQQHDISACDAAASTLMLPIRAQSEKKHHFIPRFSRLSKRTPARVVDCCSECLGCMSSESLGEHNCPRNLLAIPRGGHARGGAHHHHDAAETLAAGAAEAGSAITPYGIPLNVWKIIFQAILTTINVVCWLVPLKSKKISENKLGLSLANAFSGGVFLSLAFGHLIPECVHGFRGVGSDVNEALPFMIVLGGYLLIFFVEKVAFDAHEIMHEMEGGGGHNHHSDSSDSKVTENGSDSVSRQDSPSGFTGRSAVILLGALAVHSILEMTALGLADSFGDSALLSLSIALHQPAESIALLVAFLKSGMPKDQIVKFLSIFSCMGPIGVAIGMAVNNFASPVVDATMLAVVAGTFVYVGATEVIPEEWEDSEHKWKKFLALISGIVSIFAITQYTMTLEEGF
eukprot:CAMPEP_0172551258 /NCGR_PEP_ID=MMETSP1067-20121228/37206_1 /TAXON_ID=265564 ORGANISM="Thalassiosira punctigera, Strain Tpunct2005C2" /NCGR_SAMPLE_ID=MMETSP1067 /ASSEMBLY_ACC=CAM_ASM_000444 /LENGTH=484 /DNA_ID=CAMNT_0013339021 /DNA_START=54 /DNA_END=1508 /DNA_ORIENTATION=+